MDTLNHAYASDLTTLIESDQPALWVHGHIHTHSDYLIGVTRILANPLGREGERTGFIENLVVAVN
jgi:Icc-related predicted phosphoesterase